MHDCEQGSNLRSGRELALHILNEHFDRVKVSDLLDNRIRLELGEIGEGKAGLQLSNPLGCELAVGNPLRIRHEVLWEQFAARDLDPKIALQAENDVQKID